MVSLWLAGSPGRKHLAGILKYINEGHPWNIRILSDPANLTDEVLESAEKEGVDGLFVCPTLASSSALARSSIPTILADFPPPALMNRRFGLKMMFSDEEAIGAVGARYFRSLGSFASYAFVPDLENRGWSRLRERGFKAALSKIPCHVFDSRQHELPSWLKSLPHPTAVMTAYDFRATDVLEACKAAQLTVPGDVAILGVDNDELLCEYSKPTLSSIRIDHEANGYFAAKLLDKMMRSRRPFETERVFTPIGTVAERESTRRVPAAEFLVQKAQAYIREKARHGIGVSDVVAHLGVSRRLADLRFSALAGCSLRKAIENERLSLIRRQLETTTLPVAKISALAGFKNVQRAKYVFKAHSGLSMTDWRRQSARKSATDSQAG